MEPRLHKGAKGIFFSLLVSILGLVSAQAQSGSAREQIRNANKQDELHTMIADWEREEQSKNLKISQVLTSKGLQKRGKTLDGSPMELIELGPDGSPLYYTTLNDPASRTSRAHSLYPDGLLHLGLYGQGMEVGVWDAGVALGSHQEFAGRAIPADGAKEVTLHATLVTGNLISSGVQAAAQGIAYGAVARTHDWGRDKIEAAQAASQGMLISNHSYGILSDQVPDWYFGAYIQVSRDWDQIMYNAPYYLMVAAAGNAQRSGDNAAPMYGDAGDGFDLLLGFTTAKNGLTVAGANTEIGPSGELISASVAPYSSFGPMDDGRIKPDLAGDGSNILSTSSSSNSSYQVSAGTSMAAPGVTGSLLLLQQLHQEIFGTYMKAASLKGLILHSADEVGAPGPDYKMGWGVINAQSAAELLQNREYSSLLKEESLAEGESYSLSVNAKGDEPLMVSLSWTDPQGHAVNHGVLNSTQASLVNDLDIRIIKGTNEQHLPWRLDPAKAYALATQGDNSVDPYERIELPRASGSYTITVTHKGKLKNGLQDFTLIVSGAQISNCILQPPGGLELATLTQTGATLGWDPAGETLFELQYKGLESGTWDSQLLWGHEFELQDLEPGKVYQARLRSICSESALSGYSPTLSFEFRGRDTQSMENGALGRPRELQLTLFPNPTVEYLNLGNKPSGPTQYSIVTSSGVVVQKGRLEGNIPVSALADGLYVLVVQDLLGIRSSKFYKGAPLRFF